MATKSEIVEELKAKGIEHDPASSVASLKSLLHSTSALAGEVAVEDKPKKAKVDADLQARWDAFIATAEAQAIANGTKHVFDAQKERGEFDTIPTSFTDPSNNLIQKAR